MNFKDMYKNLGILVLAGSMTTGCVPNPNYEAERAIKEKAKQEQRALREAEKNLPSEITITGQIVEEKSDYANGHNLTSIHWKLTTTSGPKLATIADKCGCDDTPGLKTVEMLNVGDMVKITYERSKRKKIDENTGHLFITPEQIVPVGYGSRYHSEGQER